MMEGKLDIILGIMSQLEGIPGHAHPGSMPLSTSKSPSVEDSELPEAKHLQQQVNRLEALLVCSSSPLTPTVDTVLDGMLARQRAMPCTWPCLHFDISEGEPAKLGESSGEIEIEKKDEGDGMTNEKGVAEGEHVQEEEGDVLQGQRV